MKKLLCVRYKKEIPLTELDLVLQDNIFGINPDGHDYEYVETRDNDKFYWIGEGNPINIDFLIEKLNELKKDKCNYAEISIHTDHEGYYLYGLEVSAGNKKRVLTEEKRKLYNKIKLLDQSIKNSESKLIEDKNKLNILNEEYSNFIKKHGGEK